MVVAVVSIGVVVSVSVSVEEDHSLVCSGEIRNVALGGVGDVVNAHEKRMFG